MRDSKQKMKTQGHEEFNARKYKEFEINKYIKIFMLLISCWNGWTANETWYYRKYPEDMDKICLWKWFVNIYLPKEFYKWNLFPFIFHFLHPPKKKKKTRLHWKLHTFFRGKKIIFSEDTIIAHVIYREINTD